MAATASSVPAVSLEVKTTTGQLVSLTDEDNVLKQHNIIFTMRQGQFPYAEGNCHTIEEVLSSVNAGHNLDTSFSSCTGICCCLATCGIGICCRQALVDQGEYGFAVDQYHGKFAILPPGRHFTRCCLEVQKIVKTSDLKIVNGSTSIIRVETGQFGLAHHDGKPSILLPGLHAHNNGNWVFQAFVPSDGDWDMGPLHVFTVSPGTVRWAFISGKLQIFRMGRYFVNDTAFKISDKPISLALQQTGLNDQIVTLDRAVSLRVKSSVLWRILNPDAYISGGCDDANLVNQFDVQCRNALCALFAKITFDQLSSAAIPTVAATADAKYGDAAQLSITGSRTAQHNPLILSGAEGVPAHKVDRDELCGEVKTILQRQFVPYGVEIRTISLNWRLADEKFASDYETAGLKLASVRVQQAAVAVENALAISRAQNDVDVQKLNAVRDREALSIRTQAEVDMINMRAEGERKAAGIRAQADAYTVTTKADAEAKAIETIGKARNAAAESMVSTFGQNLAFAEQHVAAVAAFRPVNSTFVLTGQGDAAAGEGGIVQSILKNQSFPIMRRDDHNAKK